MPSSLPLAGVRVLEHGDRMAVTACGSILATLGAEVCAVRSHAQAAIPPAHRHGKHYVAGNAAAAIGHALEQAHVIIASTDTAPLARFTRAETQVVCDITAYGSSGPMAGIAHSDALIQAVTGLADTTGDPDAAPTLCPFPQVEGIAALYAAAGILTALHVRAHTGFGQEVEIALFDCAFSTLSTFLPFHFVGKPVTRSGNRHVLASPWNAYRAADGWLLICTGADEQWQRLCIVIQRPDLAADPRLHKAQDRLGHAALVDAAIHGWINRLSVRSAADQLQVQGIAAGAIVAARDLPSEPNIVHRGVYAPQGFRSAIKYFPARHRFQDTSRAKCTGRTWFAPPGEQLPLAGINVLEIGQYTTAPLVARNLGALGARVLKIEPPNGDASRVWPPQQYGQGYFFALSNSDKQNLCLDLRAGTDSERFRALLAETDVLVENLKPGSLDKLGFGPAEQARINPRLIYCAISGFGADSAYPGRPAFDTVIQAMSGIMDLVRAGDVPQKTGISYADILGGLFALVGTLAALLDRENTSYGDALDISMQDAAAWITQWAVAAPNAQTHRQIIACSDGYLAAEISQEALSTLPGPRTQTRAALLDHLRARGISAALVASVAEAAQSAQAQARNLLITAPDSLGRTWPVFASPIRLSRTPARVRRAIGPLGEAQASLDFVHQETR